MKVTSKNVLITGISTGIGYGCAASLVNRGYKVFGTVRNEKDALKVKSDLGENLTPLLCDVTIHDQVSSMAAKLEDAIANEGLYCLVNNSGIAIGGPLQHQSMEDIRKQFEVNVFGLLQVTKATLPLLGAQKDASFGPGRIINISSAGGKMQAPFVGAYTGTKHAVEGLSGSLRRELLLYGIDVIVVGPGAVKTPIWDKGIKMEEYAHTDYARILKRFSKGAMKGAEKGLTIEYLGEQIADIVQSSKPKTRYAFVPQKLTNWTIPKMLPDRWVDGFIKKQLLKS